ncbi:hypothetical protein AURANDRAFT_69323, partial [Aureococcus anophagefferens]
MELDASSKTVQSSHTPHAALVSPAPQTNICPSACDVKTINDLARLLEGATLSDAAKRLSASLVALVAQDNLVVAQRLLDHAAARARAVADLAAASDSFVSFENDDDDDAPPAYALSDGEADDAELAEAARHAEQPEGVVTRMRSRRAVAVVTPDSDLMELSVESTMDVSNSAAVGTTVIVFGPNSFFTFTGLAYETERREAMELAHRAGAQTLVTLCLSTTYLVVGSREGTRKRRYAEGIHEAEVVSLDVFTAAAQAA